MERGGGSNRRVRCSALSVAIDSPASAPHADDSAFPHPPCRATWLAPDFGPDLPDDSRGVTCVGAVPWITNFNVPLRSPASLEAARRLAKAISQRNPDGGIPTVQSMALARGGVVEVACNLLDFHVAPPELVEERLRELARAEGLELGDAYVIGKRLPEILAEL